MAGDSPAVHRGAKSAITQTLDIAQQRTGEVHPTPTFQAFAKYWGFDARLCRPYRAQTKGKVESGVKVPQADFLVGRGFVDDVHLGEALLDWTMTIAD